MNCFCSQKQIPSWYYDYMVCTYWFPLVILLNKILHIGILPFIVSIAS